MKSFLSISIIVCILFLFTEARAQRADSVRYYQRQLGELLRRNHDSLRNSAEYIYLSDAVKRVSGQSGDYNGSLLFSEVLHCNYKQLNGSLTPNGFSALSEYAFRFGFATTHKTNNHIFDFAFIVSGIDNKSTKGEETVNTALNSVFQLDWGYDFLNSKKINLYPYTGFSLRLSSLEYSKPAQLNPTFTDLTNIIQDYRSVSTQSIRLGYQAGIGLDVMLSNRNQRAVFFFTKGGVNRPVGKDKYKIHGVKYDPGIRQGDWLIAFGFKFVHWY